MRQRGLIGIMLLLGFVLILPLTAQQSPEPPDSAPAGEARLLRFPDIHGDQVVFVSAGDLWSVPLDGGAATRLTTADGLELAPHFSPDGRWIAFSGEYDGNRDVYVIPAAGGPARRLTWRAASYGELRHGYDNYPLDWTPDGKRVLFRSWRESFEMWFERLFTVAVDNPGLPEALELPEGGLAAYSPDGAQLAYNRQFRNFRTWKYYRGGLAQDLWRWDFQRKESKRLTDWEGTDTSPMWLGNTICYNSDQAGKFNIFAIGPEGGRPRQLTFHQRWDVRWPGSGPGGIVYECGGYLYHLDPESGQARRITVRLGSDRVHARPAYREVKDRIQTYNLSASGRRAVFEARGELFTVPAEHGEARQLTATSGARERYPVWSPDGRWVCYVSDQTGEDELFLIEPGPEKGLGRKVVQLTQGAERQRYNPVWSPDSKRIAFAERSLRLWVVEVESQRMTMVDSSEIWEFQSYSFSPDGRWLAYAKPVQRDRQFYSIFLYDLRENRRHEVTGPMTNDYEPVFDPTGKYLYFISGRDLHPRMGTFEMNFIYSELDRVYLLTLAKDTPSPLAPRSDEEGGDSLRTQPDVSRQAGGGRGQESGKDRADAAEAPAKGGKTPAVTRIDLEGLDQRIVPLSGQPGNYIGLRAAAGKVFWLAAGEPGGSAMSLRGYDLAERKETGLADGIQGYDISPDGGKLIVRRGADYYIVPAETKPLSLDRALDLSGLRARVDFQAEWRQIFHEVWRQERDFFYVANLHGLDWTAVRRRYEPLLEHVAHRDDLNYVLGEMIAELAVSHAYVGGGDYPEVERVESGLLGCEFERAEGRWRIARILPGNNWKSDERSPLTLPGVDVSAGDYLLAIDGEALTDSISPYRLLEGKGGKTVLLTVGKGPELSQARTMRVETIRNEMPLRYQQWVEGNLAKVRQASGGRIGYLHIPDMGLDGLNEFVRRYYAQLGQVEGFIIDVRYNGGGFVSQMILERLNRKPIGMDAPRYGLQETYPSAAFQGPMVCLINEYSASDGDIFPYFFRQQGLGPLVGKRTWGGVVGIRGYSPLVDGGYITRPEFGTYGLDSRWIIENEGVRPDYEVDKLPEDAIAGRDPQLEKALELVLQQLPEKAFKLPPKPVPPVKRSGDEGGERNQR